MLLSSSLLVLPAISGPAAAAPVVMRIGTAESLDTFNPFSMKSSVSLMIAWEMYEVLVTRDPSTLQPAPMLAQSWDVSPDGKAWTFHLVQNSVWHDGTPVTAEDVNWTFNFMLTHPKEGVLYQSYMKNITQVVATDTHTVRFTSDVPKATMLSLNVPILPKHLWSAVPLTQISNVDLWNTKYFPNGPVGSGPMVLDSYDKTSGDIWMSKWAQYHGGTGTINVDQVLYKMFTTEDAMMSSLYSGGIDLAMQVPGSMWNSTIARPGIDGQVANQLDIHNLGFNCASPSSRFATDSLGHQLFPKASTNIETWNVTVRRACAMAINKTEIVTGILKGLADEGTTVVPPITPFWRYDVPDEEKIRFDPAGARALLEAAGFRDIDGDGVRENVSSPSSELRFSFYYPAGYPSDALASQKIAAWLADIGISAPATSISEALLYSYQYNMKYDMFFWSWWPEIDPSFILSVLTTSEIADDSGDWSALSDTFYSNATYDSLFAQQLLAVNFTERQSIIRQMQSIAYHDCPYIIMWYPYSLFAYRLDKFSNFPDFDAEPGATPDTFRFFMQITTLGGNMSPNFDSPLNPSYSPVVGTLQTFQVQVSDVDADRLWVNWSFGDGTPETKQTVASGTSSTPRTMTVTHTYMAVNSAPGFTLSVNLSDGHAGHEKVSSATVYVIEAPDLGPTFTSLVDSSPSRTAYNDTVVTWFVNASDHESGGAGGFGLRFTWDWGDGQFTVSNHQPTLDDVPVVDSATHSWSMPMTYDVQVWVWDGSAVPGHNVSSSVMTFIVKENTAPTSPNIASISGTEGTWIACLASSVDADPDWLKITWVWDDGTYSVTINSPNAGAQMTSIVQHKWPVTGAAATYPVTVWVDDGTGYPGHNISGSITANIAPVGANVSPTSLWIVPPPSPTYVNVTHFIQTSAVDADGDALRFFMEFGDGSSAVTDFPAGVAARQYFNFSHVYAAADAYTIRLWVNDTTGPADHNSTATSTVVVIENHPPMVLLPSSLSAGYNKTFTVSPTQCMDDDADPIKIWYDWGDQSPMSTGGNASCSYAGTHVYSQLGNKTLTVHVDDGTGLNGHNVTATATVKVSESNLKPEIVGAITKSPSKTSYLPNETMTFTIGVRDFEGDNMTLIVEFGDGAKEEVTIVGVQANVNSTKSITHSYTAGRMTAYVVNATVKDGKDHSDMIWNTGRTSVQVTAEDTPPPTHGFPLALAAGIAMIAVVALLVTLLFLRRRKGDESSERESPPPPEAT